ncbi:MAG: PD-(D/E)XK nuclease family protein [Verrucomicrobia bacterium]|nr:PD-(D/E)XK nuclease family protein [Verrucomicrobiota bacterium]MBV8277509.1 PD-(D/E)XK nuclease family protein [Verrucomicrobiota bacterium]
MPTDVSIQLFNHVDDAWSDGLRDWLETGSEAALSGQKVWMVCRSFVQANWLRRRFLEEAKTLMGVRFLDLRRLRRELCLRAGLPTPSFGRETLSLILRANMTEAEAASAYAGQLLDALDNLAACGWLDRFGADTAMNVLHVTQSLRPAVREIIASLLWRPRVDQALVETNIRIPKLRLGFFGLDAQSLDQQALIAAALSASEQAYFWVAQPLVGQDIFMRWIERLETRLHATVSVAASQGERRPYEDLVSQFVYPTKPPETVPKLIRGARWSDQVRAVVAVVQEEFGRDRRDIAIAIPQGSPSGAAIVEALIAVGIPVSDEFRSNAILASSERVHRWLANWVVGPRTPEKLLQLVNLLAHGPDSYGRFRDYLLRQFDDRQTRLVAELLPVEGGYRWIRELVEFGPDWPEKGSWKQLDAKWSDTAIQFQEFLNQHRSFLRPVRISLEPLQPNWDEIGNALGDLVISSGLFLRFVFDSFSAPSRIGHREASHRYAPVVVSTPEQLHATSWDAVILVDGIGDLWTRPVEQDSLLSQEFRTRARGEGFLLPTIQDHASLREDAILQLIQHGRSSVTLCGYAKEESGEEVDANRFVTFIEHSLGAVPRWFELADTEPVNLFPLLGKIRRERCDPEHGFDEYLFDFSSLDLKADAWSASELQKAIAAPGTFAFRQLFGVRRTWDRRFERDGRRTLGTTLHNLMKVILRHPLGDLFKEDLGDLRQSSGLKESRGPNAYRYITKIALGWNLPTEDAWWKSIIAKAAHLVEGMSQKLTDRLEDFPYGISEYSSGDKIVPELQLFLKGRFDLLLANVDHIDGADIVIIDFKTTNSIRRFNADTGEGFQIVAYTLLAKVLGAAHCAQFVFTPASAKELDLNNGADEIIAKLNELSWMQETHCFGHAPLLRQEFAINEAMPLATLTIPVWVLRKKRALLAEGIIDTQDSDPPMPS